ncbi:MAG: TIM-barrel domain-containing protein [Anaerolineae bacterium]
MADDNTQYEQDFVVKTVDDFKQQIVDNKAVMQAYRAKYQQKLDATEAWQAFASVTHIEQDGRTIKLTLEGGIAHLTWITPSTLHVRIMRQDEAEHPHFSYIVQDQVTYDETLPRLHIIDELITVEIGAFTYEIEQNTFTLRCLRDETIMWEHAQFEWQAQNKQIAVDIALQKDEASYGTGERAFDLNLRGRDLPIWNTDPGGYQRGDDPINACVPFYLGVHQGGSYGVLWDSTSRTHFDIGSSDTARLRISGSGDGLSCYFFTGQGADDVLNAYTNITGRMALPPLWAIGYHQSRYSYMNADEVLATARKLHERQIPCDAIYLDIHYMDGNRVFTWDRENFPDMKAMIDQLHDMGIKVVPILDPGVKVDAGYAGYDSGIEQDVFVKYPDDTYSSGVVWPGLCHFPDFSAPAVRGWWVEQLNNLLETGIDGIWNDMNEPLVFDDETGPVDLPDFVQHDKEGLGATHEEIHNVYGTLMARASLMALQQHRPDKRQFTFTRACTAGTQRYASSWTGDNHSTWDDLHIAITTCLQMGLSGIAFTGSDVGGFMRDVDGELLTRWIQAGAMMPFFRNHSAVDVIQQEPWCFGERYEVAIRDAIQLRYRLMPYLYTAFAQHAHYGLPIIRPVFMAEPDNPNIRDIDDCFMLGDNMLVAPILKPQSIRRSVYLPDGDWYELHTNRRYHGGTLVSVDAPLAYTPIFVRSGTVLPMWDTRLSLSKLTIDTLKLRVYTDSGKTVIYEDAGEGLAYRDGDYRWVTYQAEEHADSLTLTRSVVGDYNAPYQQIELQLVGARSAITQIDVDGMAHFNIKTVDDMTVITVKADFKEVKFKA